MLHHPGERALARADRELRGLLAVVDLPQGDAAVLQEGEIKYRIVNDRGDALEQLEGLCACLGDVDDRGALPAAVELQQPDRGPVRVEAGGFGIFDLGAKDLESGVSLGGESVDFGLRRPFLFLYRPVSDRQVVDFLSVCDELRRAARARSE